MTHGRKGFIQALFLAFILSPSLLAENRYPALITDTLDQFINRAMKQWDIPGLALCVVKDGRVIVMKGYGVKETGKSDPVDENTLFMIGSNTKAFTATSLVMLENRGACSLDDPVQKWLPEFSQTDPWVAAHATLRDILCHRLGYETFQGDFMYWDSDLSQTDVLEKFGQIQPLFPFRARFGYTNAAFHTAGQCIEKISQVPWDEFVIRNLVRPLEMNRTLMKMGDFSAATNIALPHSRVNGKIRTIPLCNVDDMPAAASMSSSANDMSHWILSQLDNGKFKDNLIIPYSVILRTRMPQTIIGRNLYGSRTNYKLYGLGWFLQDYDGREIVYHTGAVDGFLSSVTLLPEEKLGIVILTNTDDNDFFETLKWELVDAFLNVPSSGYNEQIYSLFRKDEEDVNARIRSWQDSATLGMKPDLPLDAYCGQYTHPVYGYLTIAREKNRLKMTFEHHPKLSAILEPISGNRFLCTYSIPVFGITLIPFKVENGKVQDLVLSVSDFIEKTTYRFVKTDGFKDTPGKK